MFCNSHEHLHVCSIPVVPPDCEEPSAALQFFSACFTSRYGEVHPFFYIGSLADAVREATGVPADQVRGKKGTN